MDRLHFYQDTVGCKVHAPLPLGAPCLVEEGPSGALAWVERALWPAAPWLFSGAPPQAALGAARVSRGPRCTVPPAHVPRQYRSNWILILSKHGRSPQEHALDKAAPPAAHAASPLLRAWSLCLAFAPYLSWLLGPSPPLTVRNHTGSWTRALLELRGAATCSVQ